MEKAEWLSQVRRGILEYSIMLMLSNKEMYGYELISTLSKWEVLSTTEGTIYPLLKRLEKDNLIKFTWKNSIEGLPPRKYYCLTEEGNNFLSLMNDEWESLITSINQIKNEEW